MSENSGPSDFELEAALIDLGRHLEHPPSPDLSVPVRAHLEQHPRRSSHRPKILRPGILYPIVAVAALVTSVLVLSPGSRAAVASWFHIVGLRIEFGGSPPGRLGHGLNLGTRVPLGEAQGRVAFPILVPRDPGPPDEVYTGTPPLAGSVSLLYKARSGLPRGSATGAGLLITEYQRYFLDVKLLPPSSSITEVSIQGHPAVWIGTMPHTVYDVDQRGHLVADTIRLAGPVLIWYHGGITIRIEGQIPLEHALAIARSMRPVTGR